MAETTKRKLIVEGEFIDGISSGIKSVEREVAGLQNEVKKTTPSIMDMTTAITGSAAIMKIWQVAIDGVRKGFDLMVDTFQKGATLEMSNVALETIAKNAGIAEGELKGMRDQLAEINTWGSNATDTLKLFISAGLKDMVNEVQYASGKQGFEGYIETVKDFAASMGKTSGEAIQDFTMAIAGGNTELLDQYNITDNLQVVYKEFADSMGLTVQELTATHKSMALLNLVAERGANVAGVYNATYETTGKNLLSIRDAIVSTQEELGVTMQPLIEGFTGGVLDLFKTFRDGIVENSEAMRIFMENLSVMFNFLVQDVNSAKAAMSDFDAVAIGIGNIAKAVAITASFFKVLAGTVRVFYNSVKVMYSPVVGMIGTIASALERLANKDFKGAMGAIAIMPEAIGDAMGGLEDSWEDLSMDVLDFNEIWTTSVEDEWMSAQAAVGEAGVVIQSTAGQIQSAYQGMGDGAASGLKKLQDGIKSFNDSMRSMVISHKKKLEELKESMAELTAEMNKEMRERDKIVKHEEEAILRSSEFKIKRIQAEIDAERAKGSAMNMIRVNELQRQIDAEMATREDRMRKLKRLADAEKGAIRADYADESKELREQISEEEGIQTRYSWAFKKYGNARELDDITKLIARFVEQFGFVPKARAGMNYSSGGMAVVGEGGPELVHLPRGSSVTSTENTKGAIGSTYNFYIGGVYGVDNLKRVIVDTVNRSTSGQNRLANYNVL